MATAPDGSPVELYALLPERGEGAIVSSAVASPAALLELGCGAGRVTRQLTELGYDVVAVDESPEMLAHVAGAEIVCGRIEGLDLGRRFDAVVLASNLLSTGAAQRREFLDTCRRHSDRVIVETLPLGWRPKSGVGQLGDIETRLDVDHVDDGVVHGTMHYRSAGSSWTHAFAMRAFADEAELAAALGEAGFALERWLDRKRGWFLATAL
jgi:SAM-dependent methyltransferase